MMYRDNDHGRPLVFLVDPHDETRDLNGHWFASLGFDVVCATDARVGFAVANAYQPDLIVTELRLRHSDGLQLIRQLQATAATRHIPILVVTRLAEPDALKAAVTAGARAVIPALTGFELMRAHVTGIMAHATPRPHQRRRVSLAAILDGSVTDGTES